MPGHELDIIRPAGHRPVLHGCGGQAEHWGQVTPAGGQLHGQLRLDWGQLVSDVWLEYKEV